MNGFINNNEIIRIAIDGPAGAGKSSVARAVAERLGILYLDTGAMYRAFAYYVLNRGQLSDINDADKLSGLFEGFGLSFEEGKIFLNGEDITEQIRTPRIDKEVSVFASNAMIRREMVRLQQRIARNRSIIMEGRDICTVVLKDTAYKFYLDASVEERARRRHEQNLQKGIDSDMEKIKADIIRRDEADQSRKADPLRIDKDAYVVDSTHMTQEEVIETIIAKVDEIKNAL
ncbi:MAG: (d)CMP kinase [Eubacteriaceae bacterium]|nr:(d)CMP kinase [Eubacteriaceae bacterium]